MRVSVEDWPYVTLESMYDLPCDLFLFGAGLMKFNGSKGEHNVNVLTSLSGQIYIQNQTRTHT